MKDHTKKNSDGAGHWDEEVRYLAEKMGVSVDEMRRLLAESHKSPEEIESEMPKPKPAEA